MERESTPASCERCDFYKVGIHFGGYSAPQLCTHMMTKLFFICSRNEPSADASKAGWFAEVGWVKGGMELFAVEAAGEGFLLAGAAEVGDGVAGAGAGLVFAEDDVEDPVAADGRGEQRGIERQAAEVVASFHGGLPAGLPRGLHDAEAAQAVPLGPVGEPAGRRALPRASRRPWPFSTVVRAASSGTCRVRASSR